MNVDFDQLTTLFKEDPNLAELQAREIINDYINSLDDGRKLQAQRFQWRIDQDLGRFDNPVARMNRMVELFWIGVRDFQKSLTFTPSTKQEAVVLNFPTKINK